MAKNEPQAIRFSAQVFKVATLIDGGLRLTLDMGALPAETIVALFEAKQPGVLLEVAAVAIKVEKLTEVDDEQKNQPTDEETKGSGTRVDRRRFAVERDQ